MLYLVISRGCEKEGQINFEHFTQCMALVLCAECPSQQEGKGLVCYCVVYHLSEGGSKTAEDSWMNSAPARHEGHMSLFQIHKSGNSVLFPEKDINSPLTQPRYSNHLVFNYHIISGVLF